MLSLPVVGREINAAAARDQIERLLRSRSLRQSQSLPKLLSYLTEKTLAGEANGLKEFTIAVEALGKPDSFNPQNDSSIRVQIGRLRARLAEYFADEGSQDPVRVVLPRGSFELRFEEVEGRAPGSAELAHASARWRLAAITAGAVCIVFVVVGAYLLGGRGAEPGQVVAIARPELARLWEPYLDDSRPTLVVLGVPMFLLLEGKDRDYGTATSVLMNPDLTRWPIDEQLPDVAQGAATKILDSFHPRPHFHYVAVGESMAASLVVKNLAEIGVDTRIVRSNALSWDDLGNRNVVFIGAPKFNPHLDVADFTRNFRIGPRAIHSIHPRPGEPELFDRSGQWPEREAPALIGRYANNAGGYVTILASSHSPGTWAAADFATAPSYVRSLIGALESEHGKVPEHFEAVVQGRFEDDHPVSVELLIHRLVDGVQVSRRGDAAR